MTDQQPPQEHPDFQPPGAQPPPQPDQQYPQQQPPPPPWTPPPPQPRHGRGSIWLGIGITVATVLAWWGITTAVPYDSPVASALNALILVLPLVLVLAGIVLAAMPRTTRTGAGILIGIGAGILIAGGLCIALLATFGG